MTLFPQRRDQFEVLPPPPVRHGKYVFFAPVIVRRQPVNGADQLALCPAQHLDCCLHQIDSVVIRLAAFVAAHTTTEIDQWVGLIQRVFDRAERLVFNGAQHSGIDGQEVEYPGRRLPFVAEDHPGPRFLVSAQRFAEFDPLPAEFDTDGLDHVRLALEFGQLFKRQFEFEFFSAAPAFVNQAERPFRPARRQYQQVFEPFAGRKFAIESFRQSSLGSDRALFQNLGNEPRPVLCAEIDRQIDVRNPETAKSHPIRRKILAETRREFRQRDQYGCPRIRCHTSTPRDQLYGTSSPSSGSLVSRSRSQPSSSIFIISIATALAFAFNSGMAVYSLTQQ